MSELLFDREKAEAELEERQARSWITDVCTVEYVTRKELNPGLVDTDKPVKVYDLVIGQNARSFMASDVEVPVHYQKSPLYRVEFIQFVSPKFTMRKDDVTTSESINTAVEGVIDDYICDLEQRILRAGYRVTQIGAVGKSFHLVWLDKPALEFTDGGPEVSFYIWGTVGGVVLYFL